MQIEITSVVGKTTLSQNKEVRDIRGAGDALGAAGEHVVGEAMLKSAEDKD